MGRAAPIDRYAAPGSADRTQTRARCADCVSGRTLSALDAARRRARSRRTAAYRHGENHEDAAARIIRDAGAAGGPIATTPGVGILYMVSRVRRRPISPIAAGAPSSNVRDAGSGIPILPSLMPTYTL